MPNLCLLLLLLLGVSLAPTEAFVSGRDSRQRVENILTEQLFTVNDLLESIQRHVSRLDRWEGTVTGVESRLEALEAGEQSVSKQLEDVLKRLEKVSTDTAAVREEFASAAGTQASASLALTALGDRLVDSVSAVGESVSGLSGNLSAEHERTRGTCGGAGAELSQPLAELRTAVSQAAELAQRTDTTLTSGLQRVNSRLQETSKQLGQLEEELREERQARHTTTTPRPTTADPLRPFLDALTKSLNERASAALAAP